MFSVSVRTFALPPDRVKTTHHTWCKRAILADSGTIAEEQEWCGSKEHHNETDETAGPVDTELQKTISSHRS